MIKVTKERIFKLSRVMNQINHAIKEEELKQEDICILFSLFLPGLSNSNLNLSLKTVQKEFMAREAERVGNFINKKECEKYINEDGEFETCY